MADGKWLLGLRDDMPVVAAARHVLMARLSPVREHLTNAVFQADEDPEHVHQLRVATRRAGAALRIFMRCLPTKIYNTVRKKLRTIRRAAGAARDWDVFVEALRARAPKAPAAHRPGFDLLLGIAHGQRMAAQQVLIDATQHPNLDLDGLISAAVSALRPIPNTPPTYALRDLALPLVAEQLRLLHEAAQGDLRNYDQLHQVRIRGKRLRYAMEVFACCFDRSFQDKYYPAVAEMQEILGKANDSHVAAQRLESIRARLKATQPGEWKRYQSALESLLRHHQRLLPLKRKLFLTWWRDWQQSGAESSFGQLLKTGPLIAT